eukprot:173548-Chlamydomonas_euryale.AAC.1
MEPSIAPPPIDAPRDTSGYAATAAGPIIIDMSMSPAAAAEAYEEGGAPGSGGGGGGGMAAGRLPNPPPPYSAPLYALSPYPLPPYPPVLGGAAQPWGGGVDTLAGPAPA